MIRFENLMFMTKDLSGDQHLGSDCCSEKWVMDIIFIAEDLLLRLRI